MEAADRNGPGWREVMQSPNNAWQDAKMSLFPDQVALTKLGTRSAPSGYARTTIRVAQPTHTTLLVGSYRHWGDTLSYEIRVNGERAGVFSEIMGGYMSQGERGFMHVPMVPPSPDDITVSYAPLSAHPVQLRKGENHITIRLHRDGWVPQDPRASFMILPLCFDLRIVDENGDSLQDVKVLPPTH